MDLTQYPTLARRMRVIARALANSNQTMASAELGDSVGWSGTYTSPSGAGRTIMITPGMNLDAAMKWVMRELRGINEEDLKEGMDGITNAYTRLAIYASGSFEFYENYWYECEGEDGLSIAEDIPDREDCDPEEDE